MKTDRDLASFVDDLKAVRPQPHVVHKGHEPAPRQERPARQSSFDAAGTLRIVVAAAFALVVFFVTLAGLALYFHY